MIINLTEKIKSECEKDPEFKKLYEESSNYYNLIFTFIGIRKRLKYHKKDIAEKIGVSPSVLTNTEKRRSAPSLKTFCKMLDVMGYELQIKKKEV